MPSNFPRTVNEDDEGQPTHVLDAADHCISLRGFSTAKAREKNFVFTAI
jgi:hypothetical protein